MKTIKTVPCFRVIVLKTFLSFEMNRIIFDRLYPKIIIVTLNSTMVFSKSFMADFTRVFNSHDIIKIIIR